ncbi:hypothetical protein ES703_79047 [subsurface metagenome]
MYFESLGTEEITFAGPGTSALGTNKMFGRPLIYELKHQYSNYSAYGPFIWAYGITDESGHVSFEVSLDHDFLSDFFEIWGSMEGFNSIEDIVLYIRAFTMSDFVWDDMAIDSPNQYLCSKDDTVFNGISIIDNYNFTQSKLRDNTYVEGLVRFHKNYMAVATNDHYTYNLPDPDDPIVNEYEHLTVHLYATRANPLPDGTIHTLESITKEYSNTELEPTGESIFEDDYRYYANIEFINPSGNLIETLYKEIHEAEGSGYFTINNETMAEIVADLGPGISTLKIHIGETEYYRKSAPVMIPIEILPPYYTKFGQKNVKIDLIDPFINSYGNAFDPDYMPFESNYPHLIGTLWVDPDFSGTGDEKELSIQDYIEINIMCTIIDDGVEQEPFPLREGIMLRPGNRDGIMKFDIGLGPEDNWLMGLACKLNLSFDISYNKYDIYEDDRDVIIYLLDLRLEQNPSSSNPNTAWSLYNDKLASDHELLTILEKTETIDDSKTGAISLGGEDNG